MISNNGIFPELPPSAPTPYAGSHKPPFLKSWLYRPLLYVQKERSLRPHALQYKHLFVGFLIVRFYFIKNRDDSIKTGQYTTFLHTFFVMQLWKKMSVGGTNHMLKYKSTFSVHVATEYTLKSFQHHFVFQLSFVFVYVFL